MAFYVRNHHIVARTIVAVLGGSGLATSTRHASATARNVLPAPKSLYFKQLVAGKDFALENNQVHEFARQMNNFIYIIGDKNAGVASVIDGAWDLQAVQDIASSDHISLTSFIATHHHWDHVGGEVGGIRIPGVYEWANEGMEVHVPVQEEEIILKQTGIDKSQLRVLEDGQCMPIGNYSVEFIHTPGHSPGSMCLRLTTNTDGGDVADVLLITGDTVFPGSCGRLDLPGSDKAIMYDSLRKLATLDDHLPIYPGHGYGGESSTIGKEKQSGLLQNFSRAQWARMMG